MASLNDYTSLDEYQWRYRRPAPAVHELFAAMAPMHGQPLRRRQWRRPTLVMLTSLFFLNGATCALDIAAAKTAAADRCPQQLSAPLPEGSRRCFEVAALPTHVVADAVVPPDSTRITR